MTDVEMVVNLHVTERCNYRCTYCFGQWGVLEKPNAEKSAWADTDTAHRIMQELAEKFRSDRGANSSVRFNFVGGEPALLKNIADLVEFARTTLRARTSYVTNGLMLRRFDAEWTAANIDILGISIDSSLRETNREIGRVIRSGRVFDLADAGRRVQAVRKAADRLGVRHPEIKVNTVVSDLNHRENFDAVLATIRPDRWKILKMLPVYSAKTAISDEEFRSFAKRHRKFVRKRPGFKGVLITTEDNDEMTGSYAMVDPLARFFWYDELPESGYRYSAPMTEVSAEDAWAVAGVHWDEQKFGARYTELMGGLEHVEPEAGQLIAIS
ncbi:radical S-adenosyl methionine domain-containing protein 2 [Nocardioides luteus]|uniref:S-adenosylmethionine-dependent nucleotide dehydratase n=1 Tax=Nocardioides luteus TaxID=1844 RepID=A0ABQ5ST84_9ACTN|nr:viperin family antiviral radical SAM protein [Nocardioides luteus]MDR7309872.1 radical S-adenosyl methionine domain-containing protein 2 [Nocardioides luteus]GGR59912.1 radical SAM protein [Nocardioides luteus]GLJ67220.1 radical SAM protein [Nocardioides luteus]